MNSENINIVWIRNDLRIEDNQALFHVGIVVLPVFIWAPHEEDKNLGRFKSLASYALKSFEKDLIKIGLKLTYGIKFFDVLTQLVHKQKLRVCTGIIDLSRKSIREISL